MVERTALHGRGASSGQLLLALSERAPSGWDGASAPLRGPHGRTMLSVGCMLAKWAVVPNI